VLHLGSSISANRSNRSGYLDTSSSPTGILQCEEQSASSASVINFHELILWLSTDNTWHEAVHTGCIG
jgi:hypothetical protein